MDRHMNTTGNTQRHPLVECVLNYINMPNAGALMITGAWGCGKTYFYNHEISKAIKETGRKPIKVSLFGLESTESILNRIKEEYFYGLDDEQLANIADGVKDNKKSGILRRIGGLVNRNKDTIDDAASILSENLKPKKFFDFVTSLRSMPNDKVVICFDDLERAIRSTNTDNLMGMINDLVENHEFKVIVIANEEFMLKTDAKSLQFKEKVVEKSVAYQPDVKKIFKVIVSGLDKSSGDNGRFSELMNNSTIIQSIDPESNLYVTNRRLKSCIQNLRTIKFALGHYHRIYQDFTKGKETLEEDDLKILVYTWLFTLGVSIEFKDNKISSEDKRTLDSYQAIVRFDHLDLGNENGIDASGLFEETNEEENEQAKKDAIDHAFAGRFYNNYIKSYGEQIVFLPSVYAFITSGKEYDMQSLNTELSLIVPEPTELNPAAEIMRRLMSGLHSFTDAEFSKTLKELYSIVKKGELPDYVSFLNAAYFIQSFNELVGEPKEKIESGFKRGIDKFTARIVMTDYIKERLNMVKGQLSSTVVWLFDYAMEKISKKEETTYQEEVKILNKEFKSDITKFTSHFIVINFQTPEYISVPILKDLDLEVVKKTVVTFGPKEVGEISTLLRQRFLETGGPFMSCYAQEICFVEKIKEGIDARSMEESKLSNTLIKEELNPLIDRILKIYKEPEEANSN